MKGPQCHLEHRVGTGNCGDVSQSAPTLLLKRANYVKHHLPHRLKWKYLHFEFQKKKKKRWLANEQCFTGPVESELDGISSSRGNHINMNDREYGNHLEHLLKYRISKSSSRWGWEVCMLTSSHMLTRGLQAGDPKYVRKMLVSKKCVCVCVCVCVCARVCVCVCVC